MKHTKKLLAAALAACLLIGAGCAVNQTNADTEGHVQPLAAQGQARAASVADVPAGTWYTDAVNWCLERGLMDLAGSDTFAPGDDSNRATLAAALYRAAGSPEVGSHSFNDIPGGSWYESAAAWASANGVISGYPGGGFGGGDPITREQTVTILWRYAGSPGAEAGQDFTDEASISAYAAQAVDWSRANGVISGNPDGSFNPQGYVTRGQIAVILRQYLNNSTPSTPDDGSPQVFMTTDISPEGLMAIYEALDWTPTGNVAVKLSTGEPPASNYLDPALIADVVIMDENGSMTLPVTGGTRLTENYVGAHFADYDSFLVLSHFKGHAMAGFGGAIKNISIGIGSSQGKSHIHSGGTGGSMWGADQDSFLEAMGEAGKSVVDALDGRIVYINVMNRLSVDCDCDGNPAEPDMHDIGILASYDPVALDQACVDLVYAAEDGASLIQRIESRNGIHTIEHAAEIGLGSREYTIVNID